MTFEHGTKIEIDQELLGKHARNYNCSLLKYRDRILFAYRQDIGPSPTSRICLCLLNDEFQPLPGTHRVLTPKICDLPLQRINDPRLFICGGLVYCTYTAVYTDKTGNGLSTRNGLSTLDPYTLSPISDCLVSWTGCRRKEKNWQFFDFEGQMYCVYSITPHVVLRVGADGVCHLAGSSEPEIHWKWGEMRGGTPPILVRDRYYSFFHSSFQDRALLRYVMGCYSFEAKPPFKITSVSRVPLLRPGIKDRPSTCHPELAVVYPCGSWLLGSHWLVSYGYHDSFCRIIGLHHDRILSNMAEI
jgi:predicted GH43/DUF377 family glycosyl hydrolase